jgi:hypothetical protein
MAKYDIDHTLTDEIVCPYCGYEFGDSYEYSEGQTWCEDCGKEFSFYKYVSVTYTSFKK